MIKIVYYVKKILLTVFISTFLISIGAAISAVNAMDKLDSLQKLLSEHSITNTAVSVSPENRYSIKEYDGIIGVYDVTGELMYTVEVYIKTLPEKDRELLKNGIFATSYGELVEILGDYTA